MPRASGSRTGTKHKKRKQVRFAIGDSQSFKPKLDGLQAAAASAEAAMQSLAQDERASLFSLLDVQLQAVEDDELPRRPMRHLEHSPLCNSCSGSYVRTCQDPVCLGKHVGWSVMVASEGMAVACVLKCDGHRRIGNTNIPTDFCELRSCPDIFVDRATEAEERKRARVFFHRLVEDTFGRR